jgi:hypothetical protein
MGSHRDYAMIILAVLSIILGLGVVWISLRLSLGQSQIGAAFILGGLIVIVLQYTARTRPRHRSLWRLSQLILTMGLLGGVLGTITAGYNRPDWYFVALTIAYTGVCIGCFTSILTKKRVYILVSEVYVITLLHRAGRFYQMSTIPGNDTNFHLRLADLLGSTAFSQVGGKYESARAFHIIIDVTGELLGVSAENSLFISIIIPFAIISIGGLYTITKCLVNQRSGIIAGVLAGVADMFVVRGVTSITPSVIAIIFFLGIVYILIVTDNSPWSRFSILTLATLSLLSHHLASIVMIFLLISFYVTTIFTHKITKQEYNIPLDIYTVIGICIIMMLDWMLTPGKGGSLLSGAVYRVLRTFSGIGNTSTGYAMSLDNYSILSNWLYQPGYALILMLGVAGGILWLDPSRVSLRELLIVAGTIVMGILVYPLTLVGFDKFLLPHRILVFLIIFLIILGSSVIIEIARRPHGELIALSLVGLVIFFSLTTPYTIRNDPVYNDDRVSRTGLTESEVTGVLGILHTSDAKIFVDRQVVVRAINYQAYEAGYNETSISNYPNKNGDIERGSIVVTRDGMEQKQGIGTFGSNQQQTKSVSTCLESANYVQTTGSIHFYQATHNC